MKLRWFTSAGVEMVRQYLVVAGLARRSFSEGG